MKGNGGPHSLYPSLASDGINSIVQEVYNENEIQKIRMKALQLAKEKFASAIDVFLEQQHFVSMIYQFYSVIFAFKMDENVFWHAFWQANKCIPLYS